MRSNRRKATTLLELTVATTLILLVVVFMSSVWVRHLRMLGKSRERMTASMIAEGLLEEWSAKGWKTALADSADPGMSSGRVSMRIASKGHEVSLDYTYRVSALEDPDPARAAVVGILRATVQFPSENSQSTYREVSYETYVPKNQP